jgi:2-iminoacetate synthase ThiH
MAHAGDDSTLKPFAEKLDEYLGHLEKIKDLHEKYDSIYGYILQPMVKSISKSATKGTWVTVAVAVISLLLTALLK